MTAIDIPQELRAEDKFHHIDMGFLNRRLCITALLPEARQHFLEQQKPGSDHMTLLANDPVAPLSGCLRPARPGPPRSSARRAPPVGPSPTPRLGSSCTAPGQDGRSAPGSTPPPASGLRPGSPSAPTPYGSLPAALDPVIAALGEHQVRVGVFSVRPAPVDRQRIGQPLPARQPLGEARGSLPPLVLVQLLGQGELDLAVQPAVGALVLVWPNASAAPAA